MVQQNESSERLTLENVDYAPDVALLDYETAGLVVFRVHAVDDLSDLGQLQVLHEVVVQDRVLDQLARSAKEIKDNFGRDF